MFSPVHLRNFSQDLRSKNSIKLLFKHISLEVIPQDIDSGRFMYLEKVLNCSPALVTSLVNHRGDDVMMNWRKVLARKDIRLLHLLMVIISEMVQRIHESEEPHRDNEEIFNYRISLWGYILGSKKFWNYINKLSDNPDTEISDKNRERLSVALFEGMIKEHVDNGRRYFSSHQHMSASHNFEAAAIGLLDEKNLKEVLAEFGHEYTLAMNKGWIALMNKVTNRYFSEFEDEILREAEEMLNDSEQISHLEEGIEKNYFDALKHLEKFICVIPDSLAISRVRTQYLALSNALIENYVKIHDFSECERICNNSRDEALKLRELFEDGLIQPVHEIEIRKTLSDYYVHRAMIKYWYCSYTHRLEKLLDDNRNLVCSLEHAVKSLSEYRGLISVYIDALNFNPHNSTATARLQFAREDCTKLHIDIVKNALKGNNFEFCEHILNQLTTLDEKNNEITTCLIDVIISQVKVLISRLSTDSAKRKILTAQNLVDSQSRSNKNRSAENEILRINILLQLLEDPDFYQKFEIAIANIEQPDPEMFGTQILDIMNIDLLAGEIIGSSCINSLKCDNNKYSNEILIRIYQELLQKNLITDSIDHEWVSKEYYNLIRADIRERYTQAKTGHNPSQYSPLYEELIEKISLALKSLNGKEDYTEDLKEIQSDISIRFFLHLFSDANNDVSFQNAMKVLKRVHKNEIIRYSDDTCSYQYEIFHITEEYLKMAVIPGSESMLQNAYHLLKTAYAVFPDPLRYEFDSRIKIIQIRQLIQDLYKNGNSNDDYEKEAQFLINIFMECGKESLNREISLVRLAIVIFRDKQYRVLALKLLHSVLIRPLPLYQQIEAIVRFEMRSVEKMVSTE